MHTTTITVQLDADTAQAYEAASEEERKRIQQLVGFWLRDFLSSKNTSLRDLMATVSEKAYTRGLTQEELELLTDAS